MKKISFRVQCYICAGILLVCFILIYALETAIFNNIAWILVGLLFVINPVWPKSLDWQDHAKLKRAMRIAGVLVILIYGLLVQYGM